MPLPHGDASLHHGVVHRPPDTHGTQHRAGVLVAAYQLQPAAVDHEQIGALAHGQLSVGKCADLFMIDSRRLELVGCDQDAGSVLGTVGVRGPVDYTVVQGRVTVRQGHLVTVDEELVAREANNKCRDYLANV